MGIRITAVLDRLSGRPRQLLAVALLALGAASGLAALTPSPTVTVVVARQSLAAGAPIRAGDISLARRPAGDRPEQALTSTASALGQRPVSAVTRGEVLTRPRLAAAAFTGAVRANHTVVSIAVATGPAALVRYGTTVDVVTNSATTELSGVSPVPQVLASDARVLAIWPGKDTAADYQIVLDVPIDRAPAVALAAPGVGLSIVVRTP